MPRRTNVFQEVVAIVHEHMADGATVEESAMLVNRLTGRAREVDVVIRTAAATHDVVISIEATSSGRVATVQWVEQMIGKHQHLPTDKLILISESGFRPQARDLAAAAGVATFAPQDLAADDPVFQVISQLRSLWPKFITFRPRGVLVRVDRLGGDEDVFGAPPGLRLFLADGTEVGFLAEVFGAYLSANFRPFAEECGWMK